MDNIKRHADEDLQDQDDFKRLKNENGLDALASASTADTMSLNSEIKRPPAKARENRLEQNRKAAKESRRRKKLMIEGEFLRSSFAALSSASK